MSVRPCIITLVLPAYNEVGRIAGTIGEAKAYFEQRQQTYEIVVSAGHFTAGHGGVRRDGSLPLACSTRLY